MNFEFSIPLRQGFEFGDFFGPEALIYGFKHEGDVVEAGVASDILKALPAYLSVPEPFVAVNAATQWAHSLIEVHTAQVVKRYDAVNLRKGALTRLGGGEVVACGKGVASVDAVAHPRFVLHAVDNVGDGVFSGKQENVTKK